MAFDGSCIAALAHELNTKLQNGRIAKIVQSDKDELLLTIKNEGSTYRLLISVNPSLPLMYLTAENRQAPLNAPAFCMLLRKHLAGGKIAAITQPSMERIIDISIEHYNEMGDLCSKILTVELMGKHSNIIFRDGAKILDSIRHISAAVSSVREVLPGREYFIPFADEKTVPLNMAFETFAGIFSKNPAASSAKAIYQNITGFSPELAEEILNRAGLDSDRPAGSLTDMEITSVYERFSEIMHQISDGKFTPVIYYNGDEPASFGVIRLSICNDLQAETMPGISELISTYYSRRQVFTSMRQKSSDLRKVVQTLLAKDYKKLDVQKKQIKDSEKKDKFRVYGELLTAYGYDVEPLATSYKTINFYTDEEITIPLDPSISAIDNAKKYFEKYSKLKRTGEALSGIVRETEAEIDHLESILTSLDTATCEADIAQIRREMSDSGYVRARSEKNGRKGQNSKVRMPVSSPLHFRSSDGFDIYVGKNNYQNEDITFNLANGNDWWFHAKKIPGSHVILKTDGKELPDRAFEEAASLAAHFSKAGDADKVEIDYIQRKHIKKPGGAKPGFVIYHTNYSMTAETDISALQQVSE